ncbi:DNA polymerase III subunit psi [Vibrio sp. MACH09]|uniref:DNA polymerase III subunit psi n=1 Tax=unclassified Vibrio TaxID=2614977 RepID=UPI0014932B29|nr:MULTISPECIES: DNA polymerase III subunit psi [unclassified Vibrio]NOI64824.1 DNA polymerase III subunit psi [Vibrio sp. 99-8-1]GLO61748.1 DNA polymerase III subunit psi [Vibrio sp. MACH09]
MLSSEAEYLQEMGISRWDVIHPQRLEGYHAESIVLPEECKLLLVSAVKPKGELAELFERVLKSMGLTLDQSLHLFPNQMPYLGKQSLDWIWFSGGEAIELEGVNLISSPLLADIQGNTQQRRQLWQQICKYDH